MLGDLDLPVALRSRDLATRMVTGSDNLGANLVIRRPGSDRIDAWLGQQGLGDGIRWRASCRSGATIRRWWPRSRGMRGDHGLVHGRGRDFAFGMTTTGWRERGFAPDHQGEVFIGRVCRLVYDRLA